MQTLLERITSWWKSRGTQQITEEQVRERVHRGASYLDEVDSGWYRRVNADTLELEDGTQCVLGQLHGEFRLGLGRSHLLTLSSAPRANLSPVAYGFKCVDGVSEAWQARDYELLTEAWRAEVRERQRADSASEERLDAENSSAVARGEPVPA